MTFSFHCHQYFSEMAVSASVTRHLNYSTSATVRRVFNNIRDIGKTKQSAELAWKFRDVPDKYRFELMLPHHFNHVMDISRGFFESESLSQATGTSVDNCRTGMEWMLAYSIAANLAVTNQSWICYHKETNKPVAFRLVNPVYKDPSKAPFAIPEPTIPFSDQEMTLFNPLDETFDMVWKIFPDEKVVFKGDIMYIEEAHRSSGLYHCMINYNLNFPAIAEATGAKYLVIICTSNKSKWWYHKEGYKIIYKGPKGGKVMNVKGEMIDLPGGEFWLMATELRKTTPLDVYPFWKAIKKCPQGNY